VKVDKTVVIKHERDVVGDFFTTLSHPVRREIIRLLYERVDLPYTELLAS